MFNSRSDKGKDRFRDPEDKSIEIIQTEAEKRECKIHKRALNTSGT